MTESNQDAQEGPQDGKSEKKPAQKQEIELEQEQPTAHEPDRVQETTEPPKQAKAKVQQFESESIGLMPPEGTTIVEEKAAVKKEFLEDGGETSLGIGPSEFLQPKIELPKPVIEEKELELEAVGEEEALGTTIFAIKTAIGYEKMVADRIVGRARKRKMLVYAVMSPTKLRGYVLIEAQNNRDSIKDLIKGVEHVRSVVDGETTLNEIEHFLTPKPLVFGIMQGDIVEIISGPFKGEKAKVQQIDEAKEEITVELFDAMVSIPVTIRGDHVRVLEKESE